LKELLEGLGPRGVEKSSKCCKCSKRKQESINIRLGENIKLHEIMGLEDSTLVGCFIGRRMRGDTLKDYTKDLEYLTLVVRFLGRIMGGDTLKA
jgi:hypothetical protein